MTTHIPPAQPSESHTPTSDPTHDTPPSPSPTPVPTPTTRRLSLTPSPAFFAPRDTLNDLTVPPPAPTPLSADTNVSRPTKTYGTWGPTHLTRNPNLLPIWPIIAGLVLFLGMQILVLLPFVFYSMAQTYTTALDTGTDVTPDILTEGLSSNPIIIFGSLFLGWAGLLAGVWLAGRKYPGGWKSVVLWKVQWKKDILIGVAFVAAFFLLQTITSYLAEKLGVDVSQLSNDQLLTQYTGWTQIGIMLSAALGAPIVEELFFRGVFLRTITQRTWARPTSHGITLTLFLTLAIYLTAMTAFFLTGFTTTPPHIIAPAAGIAIAAVLTLTLTRTQNQRFRASLTGLLISTMFFGMLHAQATGASAFYTILFTSIIGAGLGALYLRTGRIGTAIIGHTLWNSTAVALTLIAVT